MGYAKTKEITLANESEKTSQKTNKNSEETIAEGKLKGQYLKPLHSQSVTTQKQTITKKVEKKLVIHNNIEGRFENYILLYSYIRWRASAFKNHHPRRR